MSPYSRMMAQTLRSVAKLWRLDPWWSLRASMFVLAVWTRGVLRGWDCHTVHGGPFKTTDSVWSV